MKRVIFSAVVCAAFGVSTIVAAHSLAASESRAPLRVAAGSVVEVPVAGRAGVPGDAAGVVLNLTAVDAAEAGFVTAWPCGEDRPEASSLNYGAGPGAVANSSLVMVGDGGAVCVFADRSVELIVDVNGWFSGRSGFTPLVPSRLLDTRGGGSASPQPSSPPPSTATGSSGTGPSTPASPRPPADAVFVETFDGNAGLENFRTGVFHRDVDVQRHGGNGGSWSADHDIRLGLEHCGNPDEGYVHTVTKADRSAANYVCRDHWMTTMGDVDSYSVVWGAPDQTFSGARQVAWEVNSTDLGGRLWWEVAIVPANASDVSCIDWLPCDVPSYPRGAVVIGNRDNTLRVWANEHEVDATWRTFCRSGQDSLDREGCASKSIRRPWSVTDNGNGTLTVNFMQHSWTTEGSFPAGEWKVVFKHHAYTPDKDNDPVGYTFHWDNIVVR